MARALLLPAIAALTLGACSSNSNRGVTGSVGIGVGVSLSTPGSVTQLQAGTTIVVSASVTADVNSSGVNWTLSGAGTLSNITATTATYNAPAMSAVTGAVDATITATAVADATASASATLVVLGTPVLNNAQLFPGNVNVPYGAAITVAGGQANYTWALAASSGPLPPGITLSGGTSAVTSITGTPSTVGSYTFTLQATDALNRVASRAMTMVVLAQDACLLNGSFAFMVSGFRGGGPATHAGSITIDTAGNITGEQDYKDGHRTTAHEAVTSGTCINRQTNSGVLTLNAASEQLIYNFSVTPPDSLGTINGARLQLIGSGADSASGQLARIDTTAISPAAPTGNFAFGLITVANQEPDTVHSGSAGRFTSSSTGVISAGVTDSNASPALASAPLAGTLSAIDAHGRGTATLIAGGDTSTLVYYLTSVGKFYLMAIDDAVGTPRSTGFLTAQSGNAAGGGFDNAALGVAPSIMSLWGAVGKNEPISVMTLARLSGGVAAAGTLNAVVDSSDHDSGAAGVPYTGQYAVDSVGRATLALSFSGTTRSFVLYLDGVGSGYVIEPASPAGDAGGLEAQYLPAGGVYPDTLDGTFVGGTQFAQAPGPITLVPTITLSFGVLSSTYTSGLFAVDSATGRGFGSLSQSGIASTPATLYVVSPTKVDLMSFGTIQVDGTISWLIQN